MLCNPKNALQYDVALGYQALNTNTTGGENTAMGTLALALNTTGAGNTAVGNNALEANTTGGSLTAVGDYALGVNTTGAYNTAVGYAALNANTTGSNNTAMGYATMHATTIGTANTAFGDQALFTNTTGVNNEALGHQALYANTTGSNNTAVGTSALYANTTGYQNTALGVGALDVNTTGTNNVAIGYGVGSTTLNGGSSNILIGTSSAVDTPSSTISNFLNIGNVIFATGMTGSLSSPAGNVGIGTTSPAASLQVASAGNTATSYTARFQGSASTFDAGGILFDQGSTYSYRLTTGTTGSSNGYLKFAYITTSSGAVQNDNILVLSSGNVGIGTASPTAGLHNALNGAASTPAEKLSGTWYSGGSSTTTKPQLLVEPSGTASTNWSTNGTGIGVNSASGFTGHLLDLEVGGAPQFYVDNNGVVFATDQFVVNSGTNSSSYLTANDLQLFAGGGGAVHEVEVTSSGNSYFNGGNVGIGTTSPVSSLDISQKTDALSLPIGTTGQRPSAVNGMIRYNTTTPALEAFVNGSWVELVTGVGSTSNITLGVSASATNPQRSGEVGTGLFSANSGQVSVAVSISGTGTDVADYASTGLNLPVATESYKINNINALWQDNTNFNMAVGDTALPTTISQTGGGTNGQFNFAAGYNALNANTTGAFNTAVGPQALLVNTTGVGNTTMGYAALHTNTTGSNSTALGANALYTATTGVNNTALGYQAGYDITTGGHNVIIGDYATTGVGITTGSNNILIGQNLQELTKTSSNQLDIGNLIFATGLASGSTMSTGNVGIGTTAPGQLLGVGSSSQFTVDTGGNVVTTSGSLTLRNNFSALYFYNTAGAQIGEISVTNGGAFDIRNIQGSQILRFGTSNTTRLVIDQNGKVGIGTTSPAQALEVNGEIQVDTLASASGTSLCINGSVISSCSSSLRYKENVKDLDIGLNELMRMRPVSFKWKGRDENDLGLIAEEVHEINPLLNTYTKDGKIEGVKYSQLTAVLVNAIKEQQKAITATMATNDNLQKQVERLESKIDAKAPNQTLGAKDTAHLTLNTKEPLTCSSTNQGTIALTHLARICACNGKSWIFTDSSAASCSW
jgi:hypothetical protein